MRAFLDLFDPQPMNLIEFHEASTHFPIGLLLAAALFDFGGIVGKKSAWRDAGFWVQMLGTLFLFVTLAAGYFGNPYAGKHSNLAQKATWHQNFAFVTTGLFVLLALWRIARKDKWRLSEMGIYALIMVTAIAVISLTGWMGAHIGD